MNSFTSFFNDFAKNLSNFLEFIYLTKYLLIAAFTDQLHIILWILEIKTVVLRILIYFENLHFLMYISLILKSLLL